MSFPPDIAEIALVKCGRHCCLCHKYCGQNIELHHIKQKFEDGEDSLDNCIPLCFDCHAQVKSYNPKHPKGRKFTDSELKKHRDNWYCKVEKSGGITLDSNFRKQDETAYNRIKLILDYDNIMFFIKGYDFGGSFHSDEIKPLKEFFYNYNNPDYEFFDMDLECMRSKLYEAISTFLDSISLYTQCDITGSDEFILRVPRDLEVNDPKEYHIAVDTINNSADNVWKTYQQFIKQCRLKILG